MDLGGLYDNKMVKAEDGTIYGWNEILAAHQNVKKLLKKKHFEKFIPIKQKRKAKVNMETEVVDDTPKVSAELEEEVTKGLNNDIK